MSTTTEPITLYAFLIQAPASGIPGFGQTILITHSLEEYEDLIRDKATCPNAKVVIIPPEKWSPPKIDGVSQQELTAKFPLIFSRIQQSMAKLGLPKVNPDELIRDGVVMPNPVSGKIFFIYKIKGEHSHIVESTTVTSEKKWWQFWK